MSKNYKNYFYCSKCGDWIKKEKAVFFFKGYEGKEFNTQHPCCPTCHRPLSTRSIKNGNGKSGKDSLTQEIISLRNTQFIKFQQRHKSAKGDYNDFNHSL